MPSDTAALFQRLRDDCGSLGISFDSFEHPAVFTVEDSEAIHRTVPGAHTKNLFLKDHNGRFWLATIPHHARADLKHLAAAMGAGRLSFGKPEDLARLLALAPGSVTPLGAIADTGVVVTIAIDQSLVEAGKIAVHPLRNTATVVFAATDLLALLRHWQHPPIIAPLVVGDSGPQQALPS